MKKNKPPDRISVRPDNLKFGPPTSRNIAIDRLNIPFFSLGYLQAFYLSGGRNPEVRET